MGYEESELYAREELQLQEEGLAQPEEPQRKEEKEERTVGESEAVFWYKLATPCYRREPHWTITKEWKQFPWGSVRFGGFTARECFHTYKSLVKDEEMFNKKVRGEKGVSRRKQKQLQKANEAFSRFAEKLAGGLVQIPIEPVEDYQRYCYCKGGVEPNPEDVFVGKFDRLSLCAACSGGEDECVNGGWYHMKCVPELAALSKDEVENMGDWWCQECLNRMAREDEEEDDI